MGGSPGGDLPTSEGDETPPSVEFTVIPSLRPMAFNKDDDWWSAMTDHHTTFPPLPQQLPVPEAVTPHTSGDEMEELEEDIQGLLLNDK